MLLVGQSPNAELSARAKQIAMGVDGANEVYNEIRQGQPIGLGEASNDTWITTKAFAALNQRPGEIVQRESDHRKR